jgi:hypothetical protein
VTRELVVTCTRKGCGAKGKSKYIDVLPEGWRIVSVRYDGPGLEFCSLLCIILWAEATREAHESQREWQSKPLPVKPIDAPLPEGALL